MQEHYQLQKTPFRNLRGNICILSHGRHPETTSEQGIWNINLREGLVYLKYWFIQVKPGEAIPGSGSFKKQESTLIQEFTENQAHQVVLEVQLWHNIQR